MFSKDNPSVKPELNPENTEKYFRETYRDEYRSHQYHILPGLERKPPPKEIFDSKPPVRQELRRFLRLKSNGSAPGPDGIPCVFYKLFPFAFEMLFLLLLRVFKEKAIPRSWSWAFIVLLVKDSNKLTNPGDMRPIACTDAAGKLFWTLINDRLRSFWTANNYLSSSQKGALNDTAGCLEHSWTLYEAIKDAKASDRQIIISWLDLKNAYGSIRHNLIQFALEWYHVPEWVANLIFQYYEQLYAFVIDPDWKPSCSRF